MGESGSLQALELIETVEIVEPLRISLVTQRLGACQSTEDLMARRVKWANTARYRVLTRSVPEQFAPYNAVIRVIGTEDLRTDYLAVLVD